MKALAALLVALMVACIGYSLFVRGAVTGQEIWHDTPAMIAFTIAIVCACTAPRLWYRTPRNEREAP